MNWRRPQNLGPAFFFAQLVSQDQKIMAPKPKRVIDSSLVGRQGGPAPAFLTQSQPAPGSFGRSTDVAAAGRLISSPARDKNYADRGIKSCGNGS